MIPKIRKILYTTDLSPNAVYALRYAINSATKHNAKLVILHVIEELTPTTKALIEPHVNQETIQQVNKQKFDYAKDKILKRIKELSQKTYELDTSFKKLFGSIELVEGNPADEILNKADRLDCDAIIMGNHSKGFLKHSYFGSTCKKVLRRIRKPVFIIPLPDDEVKELR